MYVSLHKCEGLRFGGDISIRNIIHVLPMGWPFCSRGSPNINILPTLIIHVHVVAALVIGC